MKLATFISGERPEVGLVVDDETIIPISRVLPQLAPDMLSLITHWEQARPLVEAIALQRSSPLPFASVRLLAPIPRPGKIFAIGLNYADHVAESNTSAPSHQIWFTKAGTSVTGPFDTVQLPKDCITVDYEVEMIAVIGKGGRRISKADAAARIFGYCVGNDVSERMWQLRTPQYSLGKSFDTHAPFGPWITTSDEAGDPHALGIRCSVNGMARQSSNTRHLIFNVWDQIEHISEAMTLEPGDVIFTGTPGGVGGAMKPPQFLKAGDVVRCEVDGLGHIENTFQPE
jgi:2-keto-4-pentenoate hydratase/2-oxohepta-3-ene-1,7-dioic acid hydratase in catechol pathway